MSMPLMKHPCSVCSRMTSNWCSRCQSRFYCSPQHLQSDWPRHRLSCVPLQSPGGMQHAPHHTSYSHSPPSDAYHSIPTTPSPPQHPVATFSALYFGKHEEHPRIVSIGCMPSPNPSASLCPRPMISQFLPSSGGLPPANIVLKQGLGCQLRYPLHIWYCPGSNTTNRAVYRLTSGQASRLWAGDVLVMKFSGGRRQGYMDATSLDLPALAQFFMGQK